MVQTVMLSSQQHQQHQQQAAQVSLPACVTRQPTLATPGQAACNGLYCSIPRLAGTTSKSQQLLLQQLL